MRRGNLFSRRTRYHTLSYVCAFLAPACPRRGRRFCVMRSTRSNTKVIKNFLPQGE